MTHCTDLAKVHFASKSRNEYETTDYDDGKGRYRCNMRESLYGLWDESHALYSHQPGHKGRKEPNGKNACTGQKGCLDPLCHVSCPTAGWHKTKYAYTYG